MPPDSTLPSTPEANDAAGYLRKLAAGALLGNLEAAADPAGAATRAAKELASPAYRAQQVNRLARAFKRADGGEAPDAATQALRAEVLANTERTLARLTEPQSPVKLERPERMVLEALVRSTGRPALLVLGDDLVVDLADPDLGTWKGSLVLNQDDMKKTLPSVGRIDLNGKHVGTGFVVGKLKVDEVQGGVAQPVTKGIVMTNRHVLEELADEEPDGNNGTRWVLKGAATIDFAREHGSTRTKTFAIEKALFAGPDPINYRVDFDHLDLALLQVATTNQPGDAFPSALNLAGGAKAAKRPTGIYTVGYPAEPSQLPQFNTPRDQELADALKRIFQLKYGVKRLALGAISSPLGTVSGDAKGWIFGHDATTLGGNSGSCVVALDGTNVVLGAHFGGQHFDSNFAHALAAVAALRTAGAPTLSWS